MFAYKRLMYRLYVFGVRQIVCIGTGWMVMVVVCVKAFQSFSIYQLLTLGACFAKQNCYETSFLPTIFFFFHLKMCVLWCVPILRNLVQSADGLNSWIKCCRLLMLLEASATHISCNDCLHSLESHRSALILSPIFSFCHKLIAYFDENLPESISIFNRIYQSLPHFQQTFFFFSGIGLVASLRKYWEFSFDFYRYYMDKGTIYNIVRNS